jgi:hypothetical protein
MRAQKWILPMTGLLGALAVAIIVFLAIGGTVESSDETARQEDSAGDDADGAIEPDFDDPATGGGAAGICIEGTENCVDTPIADCSDPGVDCPDLGDPDDPVTNEPSDPSVPPSAQPPDAGSVPPSSGGGAGSPGSAGGAEPAVCDGSDSDACARRASELALADLSARLGVEAEAIVLIDSEYVQWPDACLDAAAPGTACAAVITPGYVVILEHNEVEYEYHTDMGSRVVLVVDGEPAE